MTPPVLEASGLTVTAGNVALVQDVTLAVHAGETLCVVGESGCGKSLTCLAAMGLLEPPLTATGSVRMFGQEMLGLDEAALNCVRGRNAAMIFQNPGASLNPVHRVGDQVAEALSVHQNIPVAAAKRRAVELLAEVGIPDPVRRARSYPHEISGGMGQRVMIAMAMACRPKLLFADEPTTALDVTIQAQILRLTRGLVQRSGMAMVFVTHDLGVVAEVADHVAVMYAGRIVETAPVETLFRNPQHPYTRALMACRVGANRRAAVLPAIEGTVPMPGRRPPGCAFAPRCPQAAAVCASVPTLRAVGHHAAAACHFAEAQTRAA